MLVAGPGAPPAMMWEPLFEVEIPTGFVGPIRLTDGRLLGLDGNLNQLHSSDDGRTWAQSGPLPERANPALTGEIFQPMSVIRLASGAIALNYWQRLADPAGTREVRTLFRKTEDEGLSWSDPVLVTWPGTPSYPTYMIQTHDGRLIMPNEHAFGQDTRQFPHNSMKLCTAFYSDDEGASWAESADTVFVGEQDRGAYASSVEAPCVAETTDGRLLMFMRTEMQRIAQSYSSDGGVHWEQGEFNDLLSSRSEIWLDRIPETGDLLCVWNQVSAAETLNGFYRSRLSSAVSKDCGLSWQHSRTIVQTEGMDEVDRLPADQPPTFLMSSGVSPEGEPYPATGHRTVRHPRIRFVDDLAYLRYDDRRYDGPSTRASYYGAKLRALPISWFYGS